MCNVIQWDLPAKDEYSFSMGFFLSILLGEDEYSSSHAPKICISYLESSGEPTPMSSITMKTDPHFRYMNVCRSLTQKRSFLSLISLHI